LIDINKETARLQKELKQTEAELLTLKTKLDNQEFIKNAPEAIIAKNQERHEEMLRLKQKITEALSLF
jgi:valyl-tRNA synthetase